MRESDIQRKIIRYLELQGGYVVKVVVSNRTGVPDILCCINGEFWAFEVKTPGCRPTELQEWNGEQIRKAGGRYFVISSIEELKQILEENNDRQESISTSYA